MNAVRGLRALLALTPALFLAGCGASSVSLTTTEPAAGVPDGYELVFVDDFNEPELADVWSTCYWWQVDGGCTIASNDEQQWYRPEAVSVQDSAAVLTAEPIEQETTDGRKLPYRSGLITTGHVDNDVTDPGFAFTYGYVDARVRFPQGAGTWPAVWLLSADRTSLPEIDLMEWYGARPGLVTSHIHQRVDGEKESGRIEHEVDSAAGEWHDIAALWEPDRVSFYFDGQLTGTIDDPDLVPSTPMYLIINLAMGGYAGEVDGTVNQLLVDHVRIWQRSR